MKYQKPRLDYKNPTVLKMLCNALDELNSWDIKKERRGLSTEESRNLSMILRGKYSSEYLRSMLKSMLVRKTIVRYMDQQRNNSSTSINTSKDSLDSNTADFGNENTHTDAEFRRVKTENEELIRKYHELQTGLHDALTKSKHLEFEVAAFKKRETESHQRLRRFVEAELQAVNRTKFENCKGSDIQGFFASTSSD